jgi:cobalt/nickel transport system permease protein
MSHLHVPDGVLPLWLWGTALALAMVLLLVTARLIRRATPQQVAYRGALGALALAAMAVQIPIGVLDYHLTLVGPVGVLLGPAAAFQVVAVASTILAFVGHGGVTVVGLNALILGAGAALARPAFEAVARRRSPAAAMAAATAIAQAVSGGLWFLAVAYALRSTAWKAGAGHDSRPALFAGIAIPIWLVGVLVESVVAYGLARFLARVRPDLLPVGPAGTRREA